MAGNICQCFLRLAWSISTPRPCAKKASHTAPRRAIPVPPHRTFFIEQSWSLQTPAYNPSWLPTALRAFHALLTWPHLHWRHTAPWNLLPRARLLLTSAWAALLLALSQLATPSLSFHGYLPKPFGENLWPWWCPLCRITGSTPRSQCVSECGPGPWRSPNSFQGVCDVKIISIITLRHDLTYLLTTSGHWSLSWDNMTRDAVTNVKMQVFSTKPNINEIHKNVKKKKNPFSVIKIHYVSLKCYLC